MFVHNRYNAILNALERTGRADVADLRRALGISHSTLRRDLVELEHLGKVVRNHGGVAAVDYLQGEPTFLLRRGRQVEEKKAIAVRAAAMVEPNSTVYLDAGTTCLEVARQLFLRSDIRLFTHSLKIALEAVSATVPTICVGGEVRPVSEALVGGLTNHWCGHLRFDIAFVAASGVTRSGISTTEMSECAVKQALISRSQRVILVADSEKWQTPSVVQFDDWSSVDAWVVDGGIPHSAKRTLKDAGIDMCVAN